MAAEYTTGTGRDGEEIGREMDANGPQEVSNGSSAQNLRAAAAENGEQDSRLSGADIDGKPRSYSVQTMDRAPREKPSSEGFYRSQEEVDRAFGQRLASERRRWEREHRKELQQAQAGQVGKTFPGDTWLPQKKLYATEYAYLADLVTQANALAEISPGFDLMDELNNNAAFETMVANGVPVEDAYETVGQAPLLDREHSIRQDERRRILEEMENRTLSLPPVDHDPGLSGPVLDVTRISEEELTRLAERVRKGERVVI